MAVMLTEKAGPGRGCPCCSDHGRLPGCKKLMRRWVRRTEKQAIRQEIRDAR